jgi:S-adenosylmethionine:tRNA ribosyltransferase-isomerase
MFDLDDYNYDLPDDLIAQTPASSRDRSLLLVVERSKGSFSDHRFSELPGLLRAGDLLVVNNTKVFPARLYGRKETGGRIELLVIEPSASDRNGSHTRWCLLKSSKRPRKGSRLFFDEQAFGTVMELREDGRAKIAFQGATSLESLLAKRGCMPLPPYIKGGEQKSRELRARRRYQTIFARRKGSIAAPTAGLHFTPRLIERLRRRGIDVVELTHHVGPGTFRPVRTEDIRRHRIGAERYSIDEPTALAIEKTKRAGGRVVAVGTTVVRALEAVAASKGDVVAGDGETELVIVPGFRFKAIDAMITNFHLPRSSLLFLVAAFAGLELVKQAYRWAVERQYRFYSYGDAMLLL